MKRRVVITGIGAVSPVGNTANTMWNSIKDGVCGIAPITLFDASTHKAKLAGEVKELDFSQHLDKASIRKLDRFVLLAMVAAKEAWADCGMTLDAESAKRVGTIVASGIGGLSTMESEQTKGLEKGFTRTSPFFIPMTIINMAAGNIAIMLGLKNYAAGVVTACAGGTNAIGDSFRMIRDGYADAMVCGGTEACITPLGMGGFTSMKALNETEDVTRASIPFDKERTGFIMGEGAGILVLEEYEHAAARGAKIYAEVVGYGANCDAYHITAPSPNGEGGADCMTAALLDAGLTPDHIDYINAHGTSTPMNDRCETAAIKTAFGDHAKKLRISSTKSMTGHLLGAAGAIEAIITARALQDGFVPATINYRVPDEDCDLDITPNVGAVVSLRYAMSNSLGFGGHNASLILKKWEG